MSFTTNSPAGGQRALLRTQLSSRKNFIGGLEFNAMEPDSTITVDDSIQNISFVALSNQAGEYTIYLHKNDLNDTTIVKAVLKTKTPGCK
ncbi:MAG TPA: hypothetical protein VE870_16420 [Bacteroidales bacterium]|nr:hypothetical protein [Bacteroidales bacterium]